MRSGVLSVPVVGAAVRIQAGQVMLAQAHGELPRGVRQALGEGPEVRDMRVTGKAGVGMAEPPRHHVLPKEFREWFEKRGFTGESDINKFCVKLEQAHHQAIHGGGNWKLGRAWPGEWNRMIMEVLRKAESRAGRMLTRNEVLDIVARYIKVAVSLARWGTYTPETHKERADKVGDALLATPPPPGWCPLNPDDELLLTFLPDEEV